MARQELTDVQLEERFFKKKAGRLPKGGVVAPVIDPTIDQEKMASAMATMREDGVNDRAADDAQLAHAAQAVGGALMARLHKNFSHAAEVGMFMQIRELPLAVLRRIPLPEIADASANFPGTSQGSGEKTADASANLDDFCRRVFGRSATTMREEAQNFHTLGEQAYETAARLQISKAALRVTRALPPEKLEVVRAAISEGGTRAEVLSVIEDLAEKVQKAESEKAELEAERQADRDVLAKRAARIEKLERDKVLLERQDPDEQLKRLQTEAGDLVAEIRALINGALRQAVIAFTEGGSTPTAAGLVGQVHADLIALRDEFMLPDVSGETPEWKKWADAQDAAKAAAEH